MPNLTVTISTPVLTAGQSFKERHRLLPGGAWSGYTTRSNAAFTLTGLSQGNYEFEFILVLANGTECPARYFTQEVKEFECPTFTITQERTPVYRLKIEYTLPSGYVAPCRYLIGYRDIATGSGFANTTYTTLPPSPFYIPITGAQTNVRDLVIRIVADLCEDRYKYCYEDIVPAPPAVPCVPMGLFEWAVNRIKLTETTGYYQFQFTALQSVPATTNAIIHIKQSGWMPPVSPWQTNIVLNPAPNPFVFNTTIQYNRGVTAQQVSWSFYLTDGCGKTHMKGIVMTTEFI